jgi:hypothetical protein
MKDQSPVVKRLKAAVAKAAARAAGAKDEVRAAKARLKLARKLFKVEKKAARQSRRKLDAAVASALRRAPRPAATLKLKPAIRKLPAVKPAPAKAAPAKAAPAKAASKKKRARQPAKPSVKKAPTTMRSAAEVAKSVIERLQAPPPILPPTPIIPADVVASSGDSMRRGGDQSGE